MAGRPRSLKQAQLLLTAEMRARGRTWVEIAEEFRRRFRVNARVAFRQAHGWSQRQAAEQWTSNWPDDPKTFKNFSYWEMWPSPTGHAPSLDVLDRLAQLYECAVADLLADASDYGGRDRSESRGAGSAAAGPAQVPQQPAPGAPRGGGAERPEPSPVAALLRSDGPELVGWARRLRGVDFRELTRAVVAEAQRVDPTADRRALLFRLSNAFAVAAAAPTFEGPDPDERRRPSRPAVLPVPSRLRPARLDPATLAHTEQVLRNFRRQSDLLGPRSALQAALGQRTVLASMVREAPPHLRPRALSVYADVTQLIGWLMYDLGDQPAAVHYYDDAREAAHDAGNDELVSYVLCTGAQLSLSRGRPRLGADQAEAAQHWAARTSSPHARAYAADVAARMHAAIGDEAKARAALDAERAHLADARRLTAAAAPGAPPGTGTGAGAVPSQPVAGWWYFYDESFYWGTEAEVALQLDQPVDAWDAASSALRLIDRSNLHDHAMTLGFHAESLLGQGEVEQACGVLGEIARLAGINNSARIVGSLGRLLRRLEPWRRLPAVRELEERVALHRDVGPRAVP
ncbi:hypothetical protein BIV57_06200 [Mangrovactinospora gilvigrisea]|uniref:HTH cro/C1-type domain-containing protein n=1 Tax=Mangrovactinospora gilvigrisea TaxID=1428644 RepID=A0A1J7BXP2_9ACTN|nr:hypothetical protein [Mangrovactinospora gilvigrisea]OIV38265.1 hypothetical protein BIV57_06200 [Mangrovactinospora gilvigrisea]